MKRIRSGLVVPALVLAVASSGCVGFEAPVIPPTGALYSNVQAPIDVDADATQLGTKRGEAVSKTVLGLFSWGDASVRTAATNGGLTTIRHVDYEFFNVLGVYATFTTVVHGD
jgi:hypothetical protein